MELSLLAKNIEFIDGIWYAKGNSAISYPEEGNLLCFQIEDRSFWFNHRNTIITDVIRNFPPKGCFFDVGGGNGFVTKAILEQKIEAVLVEPGIQGIQNAKIRGISNLLCATLEDAHFIPASIPAIGIFDVLEHIEKDLEFLKSLFWHLEAGGYLYITVPAYKILWSHEDNSAGHFRRYTLKKLSKVLSDAGFKIKYKSYFFAFLPFPIFLIRTLPYFFGISKSSDSFSLQEGDHSKKQGLGGKILKFLLKVERNRILTSKKIPFGGSCIVVAQKIAE